MGLRAVNADTAAEQAEHRRVGLRIRAARKAQGLTMAELARRIGVTAQIIQRYEADGAPITIGRLVQIAGALNVSPTALVDWTGDAGDLAAGLTDARGRELVRAFETLPAGRRDLVMAMTRELGRSAPAPADG